MSGDALTVPQEDAFKKWLLNGGGFAGMHGSGGDPVYVWDWYADTLIGARFKGHPMSPQFQQARVVIEDRNSAITAGLGDGWTMTEEWYTFEKSPREKGVHVLATLDESTYSARRHGRRGSSHARSSNRMDTVHRRRALVLLGDRSSPRELHRAQQRSIA